MENIKLTLNDDTTMRFNVPIVKFDEEKRTVSGFATLDNVDKHGDVVAADASVKAFERFRGNIREMHMPVAVGKMVSFETKGYWDEETQKEYNGVYVTARVSKGAQDTWEKVLDGTLSGFSIGAFIKAKDDVFSDDGSSYRIIKDYELFELSLVDSPANQLANVLSIQKLSDGTTSVSGIAVNAAQEDAEMVELQETSIIERFVNKVVDLIEKKIGGNDMDNETVEEVVVDETVETAEETVEKAVDVSEVEVEEEVEVTEQVTTPEFDVDAFIATVTEKVLERLNSVEQTIDEVVTEVEEEGDDEVAKALDDVKSLVESLVATVTEVKETVAGVNDRIETLESSTATRKSVDFDSEEQETSQKPFWGTSFTGKGHISADSL